MEAQEKQTTMPTDGEKLVNNEKSEKVVNYGKLDIVEQDVSYKCPVCQQTLLLADLDKTWKPKAKRTGLCPSCYEQRIITRRKNAKANADEKEQAAERRMQVRANSAFTKVITMLKAAKLTAQHLNDLQSRQFTLQNTSIVYPLLYKKTNDYAADRKRMVLGGKNRYAHDVFSINGESYYVCNHIYKKNVNKVRTMLIDMQAIDADAFPPLVEEEKNKENVPSQTVAES